jgi:N-acetylmuramoyl-L-alanine amidase
VCSAADKAESANVTGVRFWSLGDVTRIAIEVSSDFTFKSERLIAPERLFFDLHGAKPNLGRKGMYAIPVGDALLTQIRVAENQPDVTRIVLDLVQAASVTTSQLSNPNRLMIELRSKDRVQPPATPSASGGKDFVSSGKDLVNKDLNNKTVTVIPESAAPAAVPTISAKAEPRRIDTPIVPAVTSAAKVTPAVTPTLAPLPDPVADLSEPLSGNPGLTPMAARRASGSLTRTLGLKLGRVVLDAGHGGNDVGTHGPSGFFEKDLTLDVVRRLGGLLQDRMGSDVIYTRSDDSYVGLEERTKIANERQADLFLSVHANSSSYRAAAGAETYVLNFTTSKTALELAARENASARSSIHELHELVDKIALKDKIDESREFAAKLQTSLSALSTHSTDAAKNRGVKRAPFVVLIGAAMPSVLAEIGFLTNSSEEALLRQPDYRQKIAEALYKGIEAYAQTLSRVDVARKN